MNTYRTLLIALVAVAMGACGSDSSSGNNNAPGNDNNNNAVNPLCGDGVVEGNEECDDGALNSDDTADACRTNCTNPRCGDGTTDTGEECDDGVDNADGVPDVCRLGCIAPVCGDGVTDPSFGEACDDGNATPNDGCSPACIFENCGNGVIDVGEPCDDGNFASNDGCSSGCTVEPPTWIPINSADAPDPRIEYALAYDRGRGVVVLHGGQGDGFPLDFGDTWELSSAGWTSISPPSSPQRRSKAVAFYHPVPDLVLLFGGSRQGTIFGDLWGWDGTTWTEQLFVALPPARMRTAVAYDAQRAVTVLFGGDDGIGVLGDTWEYDGVDFIEIFPATLPPGRRYHSMTYDDARGVVILAGGGDNDALFDTWEFDGVDWTEVVTQDFLLAPVAGGFAYHPPTGAAYWFGGNEQMPPETDFIDEHYTYDGLDWVAGPTPLGSWPDRRGLFHMLYSPVERGIFLFGGAQEIQGSQFLDDTHLLRWESTWPREVCDSGVDDDLDGQVDCADPDCTGVPGC